VFTAVFDALEYQHYAVDETAVNEKGVMAAGPSGA
jgi:hypothetical protein